MRDTRVRFPIRMKMNTLVTIAIIPLLALIIYLLVSMINYSRAYDEIVSNLTIANSYNIDFKEEMDESIYKLVVGYVTFDNINEDEELEDPNALLEELRQDFGTLEKFTTDDSSRRWLQILLRNIDTLEDRIEDIRKNLEDGGHYDENIEMLDNNIYILTELIRDDIQYYIYYQTRSIEQLKNQLNSQIAFLIWVCIIVLACILVAIIVASYLIQRSIVHPIRELCDVTERIAGGNFDVRAGIETNDEISVLTDSINDMSEHLEIMVEKIKEDERKMRHAEMRLLQEQINPHFLYNALDAIVALVESGSSGDAVNMILSLSTFFRLVLSGGKEMISIENEERHVRSYLEIQQVRYQDIMDYEIEIDPVIYPYKIMKMTLQPLVENALYHGIKYKREKGKVRITGTMHNGIICLTVEDTGAGMDKEALEKLREHINRPCKEREKGFGLANVNERIRMNFGMEYGLTVDSEKGVGTRIQVRIPAQRLESAGPISSLSDIRKQLPAAEGSVLVEGSCDRAADVDRGTM